jgi:hypothetical protein
MKTRKDFPSFQEIWTCCAEEKSRIASKERSQKEKDAQAYTTRFRKTQGKKMFGFQNKNSRRNSNHKDISKV